MGGLLRLFAEDLIENSRARCDPAGSPFFTNTATMKLSFQPTRPALRSFPQEVMASWRAKGGEPNIARALPVFSRGRMTVLESFRACARWRRLLRLAMAGSFIEINVVRLQELGRLTEAEGVKSCANSALRTLIRTRGLPRPMFLEIIARRE